MAKVLVIDDSDFVRGFYSDVLTEAGHTVIEAEDGPTGLRLFEVAEVDCVLLDILMPGIDGIEVLMQLRSLDTKVPVLLMTGDDPGWARRTYEEHGATAFLSKTLGAEKLKDKVEEVILESEA